MSFSKKNIVGRDGLSPLPADTLGDWFYDEVQRTDHQSASATGSRRSAEEDGRYLKSRFKRLARILKLANLASSTPYTKSMTSCKMAGCTHDFHDSIVP